MPGRRDPCDCLRPPQQPPNYEARRQGRPQPPQGDLANPCNETLVSELLVHAAHLPELGRTSDAS